MYDRSNKLVYVAVNEHGPSRSFADTLYGLNDKGGVEFRRSVGIASMSRFVTDHCYKTPSEEVECSKRNDPMLGPESLLLIVTPESTILGVDHTGTTQRTFNLNVIFNNDVNVTSLLSTIRNNDTENDTLIFAVTTGTFVPSAYTIMLRNSPDGTVFEFSSQTNLRTSHIVALDTGTPGNGSDVIRWKVPVPNNMVALGQISGVQSSASNDKGQLIVYAEDTGKAAEIFSIS
ncbi:hypothetical protein DPMN_104010 [Dreissena polymorpha]|uniref:Uncharacterized protein n=1 Tax=Dreissena polymorpha TaxID=45954 RepID=A0A9D4HB59_DREPO|nr:hypothetical protein DPMN_104010 [Dreissena polymorpha]